jgi:uncharacterized alkaline shock family protein YloU
VSHSNVEVQSAASSTRPDAPTRPDASAGSDPGGGDTRSDLPVLPEPESRGTTHIADKVVERIAARAVSEIDGATGAPRVILGQTLGSTTEKTSARASAQVDGDTVMIDVAMAVQWPSPIREVTSRVRERVAARVGELTGLSVLEVDIDVATLLTDEPRAPRVR